MRLPFCGPTYEAQSLSIDASRSINLYPETHPQDAKTVLAMIGAPGTVEWGVIGDGPIRGMCRVGVDAYVASGNKIYKLVPSGSAFEVVTLVGTLGASTGPVYMASNGLSSAGVGGDQLIIVDGDKGYIVDTSDVVLPVALTEITGGGFPSNPTYVAYTNGYFIALGGSMSFFVSNLYDGSTWNALATAAVTSSPTAIKAVIGVYQQVLFLKEDSSESWYDAGVATSVGCPFAQVSGSATDYGINAPASLARGAGGLFFLANIRNDDRGQLLGVVKMTGGVPTLISSPAITNRIKKLGTTSDAIGYCYVDAGHQFYVLTFPTADATFVYDEAAQMWHERSTYVVGPYAVHRHIGNCYLWYGNTEKHLVGSYVDGKIYEMSQDYYDDAGLPLIAVRTAQYVSDPETRGNIFFHKVEVEIESGVGYGTGQAADPKAFLSWSDDDGRTWSNEYEQSMGKVGEYRKRMVWRRLGYARARIFRLTISDPVKRVILGANAEIGR